jgi:hypothetical protein
MKKDTNAESGPAVDRAFINVLNNHEGGSVVSDVSAAMKNVMSAVALTGKAGVVTLTMNIKPASKGLGGALTFTPVIKSKVPTLEPAASIFYVDDDCNPVRDDPRQAKLNLKVVESAPASAGELREPAI